MYVMLYSNLLTNEKILRIRFKNDQRTYFKFRNNMQTEELAYGGLK